MKTFDFLGHAYDADRATLLVRMSGPDIMIKVDDMVLTSAKLVTDHFSLPCVVQHENKYHALSLPQDFKASGEIKVRLLSKPTLKRFRVGA
jgi:hypothetical protein